ncbi:hypothetical protein GBW32_05175 [Streptomyces tsukubensis]|uniref:Uncharacterized protein n=1 Tax=Streptomyces tsukubensis TaxID=83656 RepID=A0A1V4AEV8_9ACTN|nr:hypothetical protein B1H18_03150 [Streptomyces tsukubensis]QFR92557.1 hypothetical protein GBW32_05175 [Streptomyces tsukubensis]
MSGPLYVPVLPVRPHAVAAVKDLVPWTRDHMAPLWTLSAMTAEDADELQQSVNKEVGRVAAVHKYTSAWLDVPYAALDESPYANLLPFYWSHTALRPVTAPDLPASHQALATHSAREGGNGLGIRIRLPGTWNDELAERTAALLDRTDPEARMDLLLDLQAVLPGRPDAGKEALRALDALVPSPRGVRSPRCPAVSRTASTDCWTGTGATPTARTGRRGTRYARAGGRMWGRSLRRLRDAPRPQSRPGGGRRRPVAVRAAPVHDGTRLSARQVLGREAG